MRTARREKKPVQMEMSFDRGKWGGRRAGAGRKRTRRGVAHDSRDPHKRRYPVHVTLRVVREAGNLRAKAPFKVIRDAIRAAGVGCRDFRIVHFSVLANHLHLIAEATDARALGRGMQSLGIRIARRVNRLLGRKGPLFVDRYHRQDLSSPQQTRNAIAYVLQNFRRHESQRGRRCARDWLDPRSSAAWFDGWTRRRTPRAPLGAGPPVAGPETWLLAVGWRRYGLISPNEIPGYRE